MKGPSSRLGASPLSSRKHGGMASRWVCLDDEDGQVEAPASDDLEEEVGVAVDNPIENVGSTNNADIRL